MTNLGVPVDNNHITLAKLFHRPDFFYYTTWYNSFLDKDYIQIPPLVPSGARVRRIDYSLINIH